MQAIVTPLISTLGITNQRVDPSYQQMYSLQQRVNEFLWIDFAPFDGRSE